MNLAAELYEALTQGNDAFAVLRRAKAEGVSRKEAEAAAHRLFDMLPPEESCQKNMSGLTVHDYATEVILVTQNACRPEFRIWTENEN